MFSLCSCFLCELHFFTATSKHTPVSDMNGVPGCILVVVADNDFLQGDNKGIIKKCLIKKLYYYLLHEYKTEGSQFSLTWHCNYFIRTGPI